MSLYKACTPLDEALLSSYEAFISLHAALMSLYEDFIIIIHTGNAPLQPRDVCGLNQLGYGLNRSVINCDPNPDTFFSLANFVFCSLFGGGGGTNLWAF